MTVKMRIKGKESTLGRKSARKIIMQHSPRGQVWRQILYRIPVSNVHASAFPGACHFQGFCISSPPSPFSKRGQCDLCSTCEERQQVYCEAGKVGAVGHFRNTGSFQSSRKGRNNVVTSSSISVNFTRGAIAQITAVFFLSDFSIMCHLLLGDLGAFLATG